MLTANPYWYGPQPYYKTVVIRFYSDSSALRLALQSGEIDIAWRTLSPPDLQALKSSGKFQVMVGRAKASLSKIYLNGLMSSRANKPLYGPAPLRPSAAPPSCIYPWRVHIWGGSGSREAALSSWAPSRV